MQKNALLILDGDDHRQLDLHHLMQDHALVICTDGSAERFAKLTHRRLPDAIVGDFDSLSKRSVEYFASHSVRIVEEPDQYSNDFEKALRYAVANDVERLTICGLSGGRLDHTLTNLSVLARFASAFAEITLLTDRDTSHILTERRRMLILNVPERSLVSLSGLPFAGRVTTQGLLYPVKGLDFRIGEQEGLSNVVTSDPVIVSIESGVLLVTVPSTL